MKTYELRNPENIAALTEEWGLTGSRLGQR